MFRWFCLFVLSAGCSVNPERAALVAQIRSASARGVVREPTKKTVKSPPITVKKPADSQPDVLWIIWDATRPDHLSPYGYFRDTTPNLNTLAEHAYVFENASSTGSWTTPAVAGLWTGLFAHNHRVDWDPVAPVQDLHTSLVTVAERMSALGYKTAHFNFQAVYSRGHAGWQQGFDESAESYESDLAARYLKFKREAGDQPVFVTLYWLNPHSPYEPSPEHDLWTTPEMPAVRIGNEPGELNYSLVNAGEQVVSRAQFESLKARYDGELHQNDAMLGLLWRTLEAQGLANNTVFAFTSDHGEAFGEHPDQQIWHLLPYETMLHVPLILKVPGLPGRRVRTEVRNFDLVPTFVELGGGRVTDPINAKSLRPLFKREGADRSVVGAYHWNDGLVFSRMSGEKWWRGSTPKGAADHRRYSLQDDPTEQRSLDPSERSRAAYAAFLEATDLKLGLPRTQDKTDNSALKALGYVE